MVGTALALFITPKRTGMVFALLIIGIATFFAVGIAGLSIIDRYLLVPSLMLMILAAVAIGGCDDAARRRPVAAPVGGRRRCAGHLRHRLHDAARRAVTAFEANLYYRGDVHNALTQILDNQKVRAAMRCGPISVPNHKHIPDTRWLTGRGPERRDRPQRGRP